MYSEIDNTPNLRKETPEEECPRLILAPFVTPPNVVFDNVELTTTCERLLEVLNPLKCVKKVKLARSLPPGLQINLPGEWLKLEAKTCCFLTMSWTPTQPTTLRETLRFTDEKSGRFDVIVILKSAMAEYRGDDADGKNLAMNDPRAVAMRRRWHAGSLQSNHLTVTQRYNQSMEVLNKEADMQSVINAFKTIEDLTEVSPMMYNESAAYVVRGVYHVMSVMNRSASSVEVLKTAASVLANLARHPVTGPKIYEREHIPPLLKYMLRFSASEVQLFLMLATYLWLYSKYDRVRKDLTKYLHTPENHKWMENIKRSADRSKRMSQKTSKHSPRLAQNSTLLPALEPDYGNAWVDQQRYFTDPQQAMLCLFRTYKL